MTISAKKRNTWPMIFNIVITFLLLIPVFASSGQKNLTDELKKLHLEKRHARLLRRQKLLSEVNMKSDKPGKQSLKFHILGLHPHSCRKALRKIGQYQEYKNFMNFVKDSRYDDKTHYLYLKIEPPVVSKSFYLHFKIPRIQEPGTYPFTFEKGFLKNLQAVIEVISISPSNCLLKMSGKWEGQKTLYPDFLFELFAQTVLKIGLERLIRMSSV